MPFLSSLKSAVSGKTRRRKQLSVEVPSSENGFPLLHSLKPVTFPKVLSSHQHSLADQGWTTVTYSPPDPLQICSQELFQASKAFFDLPTSRKQAFQTQQGTEDGWNRVEGEKEFITLRSLDNTPEELKDAAIKFWAEAGGLLNDILGRIAESLDLPAEALTAYSQPCAELGHNKTATMLRLFRYEGFEGKEAKTVAEGTPRNLLPQIPLKLDQSSIPD
jgi:isopenicillin N synthase-like dioxygenase